MTPPATAALFEPTARPRRPWSVTLAFGLMVTAAVALLLIIPGNVDELGHLDDVVAEAAQRTGASPADVASVRSSVVVTDVGFVIAASVTGLVLLGSGWWMRGGRKPAWIVACAASGVVGLCCCGLGALALVVSGTARSSPLLDEVQRIQSATASGWTDAGEIGSLVGPVLCLTAAALLLLPPSYRYFRPPALTFDAGPHGIWTAQPGVTWPMPPE